MYKELNKLNRKPTQDRVWSIRDLTGTLTHSKSKSSKIQTPIRSGPVGFLALITGKLHNLKRKPNQHGNVRNATKHHLRLIEIGTVENEMEKTNFSCDLVFPQQACFVVHRQEGGKPFDLVYLLLFDVSPF